MDPKKATGVDALPPKILKAASNIISQPITNIANHMIKNSQFPNNLKLAQVTPIYKKEDPFVKMNYRPVSILPSMSKIFEKIINNQLSTHFENIFSNYLQLLDLTMDVKLRSSVFVKTGNNHSTKMNT